MSDLPEPLSPEIEAFLDPERRRPDPATAVQNDVLSRVGATLGLPFGPGPGGSDPSGGAAPSGHGDGGNVLAAGARSVVRGSLARTVTTLVIGGVIGSGVHEAYDRAHDRRAEHAKIAAVAPPPPAAPAAQPLPPPVSDAVAERKTPGAGHAESPSPRPAHATRVELRERDRGLGAERLLIEQARTALARENSAAALAVLERHRREFPQGELEEERESLQVVALVGLERYEQARKIGARFHQRFPRSIFGAMIDEALESIP
jgi:hypothetical protein